MIERMQAFLRDDDSGQALVEFALVFPLQLIFTFGLMQLMFLMISSLMVNYAAFRVARVAAVYGCDHEAGEEAAAHLAGIQKDAHYLVSSHPCVTAAQIILSPLCWTKTGSNDDIPVPGWGPMRGTAAAADRIMVRADRASVPGCVKVELTFYQELIFPFVDHLFVYFTDSGVHKIRIMARWGHTMHRDMSFFRIGATTTMRTAPFSVVPGADCYEYGAGF